MPRTDENMGNWGLPKVQTPLKDEPTLIDAMAGAVEEFYEKSGGKEAFECENPSHTFGWKIDTQGVRLVDCGCYTEAVWPAILSLGVGPILKTVGTKVGEKITNNLYKKYAKILQNDFIKFALNRFRRESLLIRQGVYNLLKLPPVPPGYVRIWRGEGSKKAHKALQCSSKDLVQTTNGPWGSPYRNLARAYAERIGIFAQYPGQRIPGVPDSDKFLYYLDLPIDEAKKMSPGYQGPGAKWPFLTDDPANLGDDVRVILGPVYDGTGKKLGEVKRLDDGKIVLEGVNGKTYDSASQNFHQANDISELTGTNSQGVQYTLQRPTILKRKKPDGSIEKVLDIPGPGDTRLNPQLFPYTQQDALKEVFLTDEWIGQFKLARPDATDEILEEITCREKLLEAHINKLSNDTEFAEQFINPDNASFRQQYRDELFDLTDGWGDTIKKYADSDTIIRTDFHIDDIKSVSNFSPGAGTAIANLLSKFSGLLAFLLGILSYFAIVIDKECSPLIIDETYKSSFDGPTDHRIPSDIQSRLVQIIDAVYFQGLWKGGSWDGSIFYPVFKSNNCNIDSSIGVDLGNDPSWSNIQRVLVEKRLPVWPEMTTNCECSQCPAGYQLCSYSAIINGWSDVYNICLPICGGQVVQPVRIDNVVTKANCDIRCPDGYMWVNCASSDCDKSTCQDGSDLGYCVKIPDELVSLINNDINIKYGKIDWDPVQCKWFCLNGRWIMDWTSNDGPESTGPVYSDDPRFNEKIYVPPAGPGGVGNYVPKYRFRADRFERYQEECVEPLIRDPENDCECSGAYGDIGIPEAPPGYIIFDNKVIPIVDT